MRLGRAEASLAVFKCPAFAEKADPLASLTQNSLKIALGWSGLYTT
jgi:hypothetical protein